MPFFIAIESSCDETSIAFLAPRVGSSAELIDSNLPFVDFINNVEVLGSAVSSQIAVHAQYGGVVPEVGARKHAEQIHWIFESLVREVFGADTEMASVLSEIEEIFVTTEPGLISALRVGMEFAKTIQFYTQSITGHSVSVTPVNHLRGHIASCFFNSSSAITAAVSSMASQPIFPHIHLLVSGGNTQIIVLKDWNDWQIVGKTLDDAAGESFDKIGRMLGLPYPGGVNLARIAGLKDCNPVNLTVGMKKNTSLDFSFSGLKTAVRYLIQASDIVEFEKQLSRGQLDILLNQDQTLIEASPQLTYIQGLCYSAQSVIVAQLANKLNRAIAQYHPQSIGLSGGVSANLLLRERLGQIAHHEVLKLFIPSMELTGDNAVMIGLAGILQTRLGSNSGSIV